MRARTFFRAWHVALFVVTSLITSLAGCTPGGARLPRDAHTVVEDTTLGSGDVFDVRVYGEEDLSAQYRVAQDGSIDFPLIGHVAVAGLEPPQVAEHIRAALHEGQYLVSPHVSVVVREYNSKRVSVLGAVRTPGSYALRSGMGVVEAISLAGGFTAMANRDGTTIARRVGGDMRRFAIPFDRITSGQEADVPLRSGDIVQVPERIF